MTTRTPKYDGLPQRIAALALLGVPAALGAAIFHTAKAATRRARRTPEEQDLIAATEQLALLTDLLTVQDEQLALIHEGGELTAALLLDFQRITQTAIKRLDTRADALTDAINAEHFRVNKMLYGIETANRIRAAQTNGSNGAQRFAQEQPGID